MKVQIFPKITDPTVAANLLCLCGIGALTFKPLSFQFRPWELTPTVVANHVEGCGTLIFHIRGSLVQKITSSVWLNNHTRFAHDGFRRQRLTTPLLRGHPCGWSTALAAWLTYVVGRTYCFQVDPLSGTFWSTWLFLYHTLASTATTAVVAVDANVTNPVVYHGSFGLPAAAAAGVALPEGLPYEGLTLLAPPGVPPRGWAQVIPQLWCCTSAAYLSYSSIYPLDNHPRLKTCALFQVSPLAVLLKTS